MKLSEVLQCKMKEKNIDRSTLAEIVGCSRRTIYNWEHDIRIPRDFETWDALAEALGIPTESLIHDVSRSVKERAAAEAFLSSDFPQQKKAEP